MRVTLALTIALLIVPLGVIPAFIMATLAALATQAIFLTLTRRTESAERKSSLSMEISHPGR